MSNSKVEPHTLIELSNLQPKKSLTDTSVPGWQEDEVVQEAISELPDNQWRKFVAEGHEQVEVPTSVEPLDVDVEMGEERRPSNPSESGSSPQHNADTWMTMGDRRRAFGLASRPSQPQNVEEKRMARLVRTKRCRRDSGTNNKVEEKIDEITSPMYNFFSIFDFFRPLIKLVETHSGYGVGTYFELLRWFFLITIIPAILSIGFLFIPQTIFNFTFTHVEYFRRASFRIEDMFRGQGWLEETQLFYGAYLSSVIVESGNDSASSNSTVSTFTSQYQMTLAYSWVLVFCFIIFAISILKRLLYIYKMHYVSNTDDFYRGYAGRILTMWDYNLCNEKSARIKTRSIYFEILNVKKLFIKTESRTLAHLIKMTSLYFLAIICSSAAVGASCFGLYVFASYVEFQPYSEFYIPLLAVSIAIICPKVLSLFTFGMSANSKVTTYTSLAYLVLLKMGVLTSLLCHWYYLIMCVHKELPNNDDNFTCSRLFYLNIEVHNNNTITKCWETWLGQQFYTLSFANFAVYILYCMVFYGGKCILNLIAPRFIKQSQFGIAEHVLHLVFSQTILWLGFYYSPLLPIVHFLKLLIFFGISGFVVLKMCSPHSTSLHGFRAPILIMALIALFFGGSLAALYMAMMNLHPSLGCGPFRTVSYGLAPVEEALDRVLNYFKSEDMLRPLEGVIKIVTDAGPGKWYMAIILFILFHERIRQAASGKYKEIKLQRKNITLMNKDKVFLLKRLHEAKQMNPNTTCPKRPIVTDKATRLKLSEQMDK